MKMKRFIHVFMMCIISVGLYAKEYQNPMSLYQDNYFIAGNYEAQTKVQLSAKYNIIYPSDVGIYAGYTQTSNWLVYKGRDTFYTMYQPEAFYLFESGRNMFNDYVIPYIDYFQVSPICHNSTGVEGDDHRSINIYYGQVQASVGEIYNFGINLKGFGYYTIAEKNRDIKEYKGNYEAGVFFKTKSKKVTYLDKEELWIKTGGYDWRDYKHDKKGWFCIEVRFRILTTYVQPKLFIQYYHGFDEFMVQYDKKTKSVRAGLVF